MNLQEIITDALDTYKLNPKTTYVAIIDGHKSQTLKGFVHEMSIAFKFPDYYSDNMNSFREIINDLEWLEKSDYLLLIISSEELLKMGQGDDKEYVHNLLSDIHKEWENVPNYPGEDEYRKKSHFIVHFM
ncbi:barstar family protein [Asinibacterium sp. OR53]|uniref:barstar family protein n=1 Tax=Asinibacterium sp. OR53 TaxID=925409 RepID=UPI0006851C79|nr:barstar family protein [Asinibacterium sp. OR53]